MRNRFSGSILMNVVESIAFILQGYETRVSLIDDIPFPGDPVPMMS